MAWSVVRAISGLAWTVGHVDLAILILVVFCFFLRSMEFLTLPIENVVVDLHTSEVVITLDKTKTSKQFQQSLMLRHGGLARILARARPLLPTHGPIWKASPHTFRQCFTALLKHFALEPLEFSSIVSAAAVPTHFYTKTRDLHCVTLQVRWCDVRKARIYHLPWWCSRHPGEVSLYIYVFIDLNLFIYIYIYLFKYIYFNTYICTYIYILIYIIIHLFISIHIYFSIHIYTYIFKYI